MSLDLGGIEAKYSEIQKSKITPGVTMESIYKDDNSITKTSKLITPIQESSHMESRSQACPQVAVAGTSTSSKPRWEHVAGTQSQGQSTSQSQGKQGQGQGTGAEAQVRSVGQAPAQGHAAPSQQASIGNLDAQLKSQPSNVALESGQKGRWKYSIDQTRINPLISSEDMAYGTQSYASSVNSEHETSSNATTVPKSNAGQFVPNDIPTNVSSGR